MYALQQHTQPRCPRVLTLTCPGFLTVADIKGNVGATRAFMFVLTPSPPRPAKRGAPSALRSPLSPKGAREEEGLVLASAISRRDALSARLGRGCTLGRHAILQADWNEPSTPTSPFGKSPTPKFRGLRQHADEVES